MIFVETAFYTLTACLFAFRNHQLAIIYSCLKFSPELTALVRTVALFGSDIKTFVLFLHHRFTFYFAS